MESSGATQKIREENGNEKYQYFICMDDPETVLLIDSWANQEEIDIHHASAIMEDLARLREKYDLHMRAERYISDEEGISEADKAFLKK